MQENTDTKGGAAVLYQVVDEHIAVVTLNRPQKRNAIDRATSELLRDIVREIESNAQIRVAVLTSSHETVFCAGSDLTQVLAGGSSTLDEGGFAGFVYFERKKPWIAAVRGAAVGGGFEIVLACDLVVASDEARFGLPEVLRGLFPGAGGVHRLASVLPRNVAAELIITGASITPQRALALGFVNRVVPAAQTDEAAIALARQVATSAPLAVSAALEIMRRSRSVTEPEVIRFTAEKFAEVRNSKDAIEGSKAFLEKRTPCWTGC